MYHLRPQLHRLSMRPLTTRLPTEVEIVRDFRQGNFERAIKRFCKRPPHHRSNALYETLVLACAQVPDAVAAQAVLHAMPTPTASAAHQVITALCREHNIPAALDLLAKLPDWRIQLDERMVAVITRAVVRNSTENRGGEMKRLEELTARQSVGISTFRPLSAADLFVENGGDCEQWLDDFNASRSVVQDTTQATRNMKKIISAEAALRAAKGDTIRVTNLWKSMQRNKDLSGEVGVMAAAVSAMVAAGDTGGIAALNLLMTWVKDYLYDDKTGKGRSSYSENPSAMALLITSVTTTLAVTARHAPRLALSAFDALWEMDLPKFRMSLPLAGAYFKVLQHAQLSLEETRSRIDVVREYHIQLDEQGFSMALGAILRCDERVVDKLAAGRAWIDVMKSAGIPLTVHTYNLFAGQLRYCNDPEMVSSLLSDMTNNGVVPTAVTYGLAFSACVIPGDYSSPSRKSAFPVPIWERVLAAVEEHMHVCGVSHTPNSQLSLARAYAHLGLTTKAAKEFEAYLGQVNCLERDNPVARNELEYAYSQMIFNLAHCRECSSNGPKMALFLCEQMRDASFPISDPVLNSVIVACTRMGRGKDAVDFAAASVDQDSSSKLDISGLKHLLMAHTEVCEPKDWFRTRPLALRALKEFASADISQLVKKLVISFARNQHRDVCDDLMSIAHLEISELDYILHGREFLRFRSRRSQQTTTSSDTSATKEPERVHGIKDRSIHTSDSSRDVGTLNGGSVLPL